MTTVPYRLQKTPIVPGRHPVAPGHATCNSDSYPAVLDRLKFNSTQHDLPYEPCAVPQVCHVVVPSQRTQQSPVLCFCRALHSSIHSNSTCAALSSVSATVAMALADCFSVIKSNDKLHVAFCVTGIVGCLMCYGVLQERLMAEPFPPDGAMFRDSLFLVLSNRLVTTTVSLGALVTFKLDLKPVAPLYSYVVVAFSNVVATTCQYEALKYVSFPVQTLGKCAKMIPVMIWGTIIMRKTYNLKDYLVAAGVTVGCTAFLLTGDVRSKRAESSVDTNLYGLFLMLGYLGFDGFTSNFQDKLFKGYRMTMFNQALYVQLTASLQALFVLVTSGKLWGALDFVMSHPSALLYVLLLSLAATSAQLFIYHTIKTYGALLFATVMTTRQFLSILLSCILFVHPLTLGQWVATVVVFGTLYYKAFAGKKGGKPRQESETSDEKSGKTADEERLPLKAPLGGEGVNKGSQLVATIVK